MTTKRLDIDRKRALEDTERNRTAWDKDSVEYQRKHRRALAGDKALAWGVWRIPEAELQVLGEISGRRVLEFGCGAAQWSVALAAAGAEPVGMDISGEQLRQVERDIPLVQANGMALPFREESFEIVFCDYGAATFVDPHLFLPEVARVLEPGGLFAFSTTTPLLQMCWPDGEEKVTRTLHLPYFGMGRLEWSDDGTIDYQLTFGDWIRTFRASGFTIEDLIEVQPPKGARSSFPGRPLSWARKWPAEMIWKVRKASR